MNTNNGIRWENLSFSEGWRMFSEKRKLIKGNKRKSRVVGDAYFELSKTCYDIVHAGVAQFKILLKLNIYGIVPFVVWSVTWFPLLLWCSWKMLPYSNKGVAMYETTLLTVNADTQERAEVCAKLMFSRWCESHASILYKKGFYKDAIIWGHIGLSKKKVWDHAINGHLYLVLAKAYFKKNNYKLRESYLIKSRLSQELNDKEKCDYILAKESLISAISEAEKAVQLQPEQASHIFNGCAQIFKKIGNFPKWTEKGWTTKSLQEMALKVKNAHS